MARRLPKFKFSVRRLLLVVMLVAIGCWWYAVGWPAWQEYRFRRLTKSLDSSTALELRPQTGKTLKVTSLSDGRMAVTGGIRVKVDKFTLFAERAVLWKRGPFSLPINASTPLEAYLEGDVKVKGNGPTGTLLAVYLNGENGRLALRRRELPDSENLIGRGEELRQIALAPPSD